MTLTCTKCGTINKEVKGEKPAILCCQKCNKLTLYKKDFISEFLGGFKNENNNPVRR